MNRELKKCEPFIWVIQKIYIIFEFYHVAWMKGFECLFFPITLMSDKYLLYKINVDRNIIGYLETFMHIKI